MLNRNFVKQIPLKLPIAALLLFAFLGLSVQFIFSFLAQSPYGRHLGWLDFGIPFFIAISAIIISLYRLFLKSYSSTKYSNVVIFLIISILCYAFIFQLKFVLWTIQKVNELKIGDFILKGTPSFVGLICIIIWVIKLLKLIKHDA
ncbi:hypothetical protein NF867_15770 [Solitalea sp. MAHUQ-68]|uniref:Uncharacterized protein n=1 Tax=Solitalea agri TaxID=2953739 RepID=A0A9X2F554_9SPHI|nr:hypothetical protein [Solitalea agri]MCO4294320.1 hypothetical protein [Solitalea agri]